jgi:hypothetical protein
MPEHVSILEEEDGYVRGAQNERHDAVILFLPNSWDGVLPLIPGFIPTVS